MKTLPLRLMIGAALVAGVASAARADTVPCEDMLDQLRSAEASAGSLSDADKEQLAQLEAKGIERCNADDDKRADDFFTQALALLGK